MYVHYIVIVSSIQKYPISKICWQKLCFYIFWLQEHERTTQWFEVTAGANFVCKNCCLTSFGITEIHGMACISRVNHFIPMTPSLRLGEQHDLGYGSCHFWCATERNKTLMTMEITTGVYLEQKKTLRKPSKWSQHPKWSSPHLTATDGSSPQGFSVAGFFWSSLKQAVNDKHKGWLRT